MENNSGSSPERKNWVVKFTVFQLLQLEQTRLNFAPFRKNNFRMEIAVVRSFWHLLKASKLITRPTDAFQWRFESNGNSIGLLLSSAALIYRPHLSFLFHVERNVKWSFRALKCKLYSFINLKVISVYLPNSQLWQSTKRVSRGSHLFFRLTINLLPSVSPIRSPLNVSSDMNLSVNSTLNSSHPVSPNVANMSARFKYLMPEKSLSKHRYSFSPMPNKYCQSPNLSPVVKRSPSPFLHRRDPIAVM